MATKLNFVFVDVTECRNANWVLNKRRRLIEVLTKQPT